MNECRMRIWSQFLAVGSSFLVIKIPNALHKVGHKIRNERVRMGDLDCNVAIYASGEMLPYTHLILSVNWILISTFYEYFTHSVKELAAFV